MQNIKDQIRANIAKSYEAQKKQNANKTAKSLIPTFLDQSLTDQKMISAMLISLSPTITNSIELNIVKDFFVLIQRQESEIKDFISKHLKD